LDARLSREADKEGISCLWDVTRGNLLDKNVDKVIRGNGKYLGLSS
jgi:hypothetical protein